MMCLFGHTPLRAAPLTALDFGEVCGGIAAFAASVRRIARLLLMCCYEVTPDFCCAAQRNHLVGQRSQDRQSSTRCFSSLHELTGPVPRRFSGPALPPPRA